MGAIFIGTYQFHKIVVSLCHLDMYILCFGHVHFPVTLSWTCCFFPNSPFYLYVLLFLNVGSTYERNMQNVLFWV